MAGSRWSCLSAFPEPGQMTFDTGNGGSTGPTRGKPAPPMAARMRLCPLPVSG